MSEKPYVKSVSIERVSGFGFEYKFRCPICGYEVKMGKWVEICYWVYRHMEDEHNWI